MTNDTIYAEQYERRRQLGIYWRNKASDLRGSAGALWASMSADDAYATAERLGLGSGFSFAVACWPVYHMLSGMALELLLKAVIVSKGSNPQATHDLVELARQAGAALDPGDADRLRLWSESIVWYGRYPVPKSEDRFAQHAELATRVMFDEIPSAGTLKFRRGNDALSWKDFNRVWSKFDEGYVWAAGYGLSSS